MCRTGIRTASGLFVIGTRYYFRMRVPDALVGKIGRKEFRVSLRTGDKAEAKRLSSICGSVVREFYEKARKGEGVVKSLIPEEIGYLVGEWLKKIVSDAEDRRNRGKFPVEVRRTMDEDRTDAVLELISHLENDDLQALENLEHVERMKRHALELLEVKRLNADEGTFGKLCREMLKARCRYWEYERERVENPLGDDTVAIRYSIGDNTLRKAEGSTEGTTIDLSFDPVVSTGAKQDVVKNPSLSGAASASLSEIMDEYIEFKTAEGEWRENTALGVVPRLRRFVDVLGNPKVDELTKDALRQYRTYLLGSPVRRGSRWTKYSKIPEKKLNGMILRGEIPEEDRAGKDSVNLYITEVNSFLKWATVQHDLPGWACQIIQRVKASAGRSKASGESSKRAFTVDEIRKMFSHEGFTEDGFNKAYRFWVPLIALFTGARVEEIAQMRVEDVRESVTGEAQGILCFDINDKEDKQTKNATSVRLVPVHPVLVEIGLKEYIEKLRKRGASLLFPELAVKQGNKYKRYASSVIRWFSEFRDKVGVGGPMNDEGVYCEDGKEATFHSFRNTFVTECQRKGLELAMVQQVVGHSKGSTMTDRYTDRYSPGELYEGVIVKVDFPVDVERLKRSRFGKWIRD